MSNDLVTLSLIVSELSSKLIMGKVIKVNQPESDELRLIIRNNGENYNLLISSNPNTPRINLTNSKKQNPITCPNFCMLLRKYLTNSIIKNISLENSDRIIKLTFESLDELKYTRLFNIYIELINRYSNIIFTNDNDIILNSIRQIPFDNNQKRPLVSGIKYEFLPSNTKPCIFDNEKLKTALISFNETDLSSYILFTFTGITKQTLNLILEKLQINDVKILNNEQINKLISMINSFNNGSILNNLHFYYDNKKDYLFSFDKLDYPEFSTLNEAIDHATISVDNEQRLKDRTKNYYNLVNRFINKTEKKIKINEDKLKECDNRDEYKILGELLTSNIYVVKKGQTEITVNNYYTNEDITIKLDEKLSPKDNIQKYFKKYQKLKNAESVTKEQLKINLNALEYAKCILNDLNTLQYEDSLDDILEEMQSLNIIKAQGKKVKKEKTTYYVYEVDGYTIIAGKNNIQNDYLTFKMANSQDMWCHVKESHGSHVIAFRQNGILEDKIIDIALEIAAFYSSNKSNKVEVDYTIRKNVTRKDSKHKGLVYYENYKTKIVVPNEHIEYLVSK